jgi:hypothetical protein
MADVVAVGDLAQCLAVMVAAANRLALLVFGQFRFPAQFDAAGRARGRWRADGAVTRGAAPDADLAGLCLQDHLGVALGWTTMAYRISYEDGSAITTGAEGYDRLTDNRAKAGHSVGEPPGNLPVMQRQVRGSSSSGPFVERSFEASAVMILSPAVSHLLRRWFRQAECSSNVGAADG